MTKAAKYMGYDRLVDKVLISAQDMYEQHVVEAFKVDPDSDTTKGFFQWRKFVYTN